MNAKVYVITPTVGSEYLDACIASVSNQSYQNIRHIIVQDGPCDLSLNIPMNADGRISLLSLPWNTGGEGFLGGCIYPAICQLINDGYVIFLDDDNYLDRLHIEHCMALVTSYGLDWCYSLRRLIKRNGEYLCMDDCNSLGVWPAYDGNYHHIDTNCYFLSHEVARQSAWMLRKKAYLQGAQEGDRALAKHLIGTDYKFFCTGAYSVNYRVKSHSGYLDQDVEKYYLNGNTYMKQIYSNFPWAALGCAGLMTEHPAFGFKWKGADGE